MRRADPRFPVGRTRLETVGVVACAVIMTLSTLEVIQSSSYDLYAGIFQGETKAWHAYAKVMKSAPCVPVALTIAGSVRVLSVRQEDACIQRLKLRRHCCLQGVNEVALTYARLCLLCTPLSASYQLPAIAC